MLSLLEDEELDSDEDELDDELSLEEAGVEDEVVSLEEAFPLDDESVVPPQEARSTAAARTKAAPRFFFIS